MRTHLRTSTETASRHAAGKRRALVASAALVLLAACGNSTAPEALAVRFEEPSFSSDEARAEWPLQPTILGGRTLEVRGLVQFGCGAVRASASRRGETVRLSIEVQGDDRPCPAIFPAWRPYRAVVSGLEAGTYEVSVRVTGLSDPAVSSATLHD